MRRNGRGSTDRRIDGRVEGRLDRCGPDRCPTDIFKRYIYTRIYLYIYINTISLSLYIYTYCRASQTGDAAWARVRYRVQFRTLAYCSVAFVFLAWLLWLLFLSHASRAPPETSYQTRLRRASEKRPGKIPQAGGGEAFLS